jgi:hypothetical protein
MPGNTISESWCKITRRDCTTPTLYWDSYLPIVIVRRQHYTGTRTYPSWLYDANTILGLVLTRRDCTTPTLYWDSYLPIVIVRRQHYTGTRVSTAGHPCTMDGKQHQNHQQGDDHDCLNVHSHCILVFWLFFFGFLGFTNLFKYIMKWFFFFLKFKI